MKVENRLTKRVAINLEKNPDSKSIDGFSISSAGAVTYETKSLNTSMRSESS